MNFYFYFFLSFLPFNNNEARDALMRMILFNNHAFVVIVEEQCFSNFFCYLFKPWTHFSNLLREKLYDTTSFDPTTPKRVSLCSTLARRWLERFPQLPTFGHLVIILPWWRSLPLGSATTFRWTKYCWPLSIGQGEFRGQYCNNLSFNPEKLSPSLSGTFWVHSTLLGSSIFLHKLDFLLSLMYSM